MGAVQITIHSTVYEPWEEDQDQPDVRSRESETHQFDGVNDAVEFLCREWGAQEASSWPDVFEHTWWSRCDGVEPDGSHADHSAHVKGPHALQVNRRVARYLNR